MKLSELEERARQEREEAAALAAEQKMEEQIAAAEAAEEFRQKVIAWMVKEGSLDATELQAALSVGDYNARYVKLSLPEHTAIAFQVVSTEQGLTVRQGRFDVEKAYGSYDRYCTSLGYALVAASEEYQEKAEREAEHEGREAHREIEREIREEFATERGLKYLGLLDDHPILKPILDLLGAFMEDREQFAEDLERAEESYAGVESRYQEELELANSAVRRAERERDDLQRDLWDTKDELSQTEEELRASKRGW